MSRLTVKALWLGKKSEDLREFKNSYGGFFHVWKAMSERYLGEKASWLVVCDDLDRLWPLCAHPEIPAHHRAVLSMTYDNAYVLRQHFERAAQDIRAWLKDFSLVGGENHWPALASLFESNPDVPAIGFHWSSVTADPFGNGWDEDAECETPPEWGTFWSLYDEFDALEAELRGRPRQPWAKGPLVGHLDSPAVELKKHPTQELRVSANQSSKTGSSVLCRAIQFWTSLRVMAKRGRQPTTSL
jgi:hypothetical protein